MPFEPGISGNVSGRPKGSINKRSAFIQEALSTIIQDGIEQFKEDLKGLDPEDRVKAYILILEYIVPKRSRATISIDDEDRPRQVFQIGDEIFEL
jgi:hypothetical protein